MSISSQRRTIAYVALGNVRQILDSSDNVVAYYEYDPFGKLISKGGTYADANRYRHATKPYDEDTGLYYYTYRHYNPESGRWINRDPIAEEGGLNLYAFCSNNGINLWDLWGNFKWEKLEPIPVEDLSYLKNLELYPKDNGLTIGYNESAFFEGITTNINPSVFLDGNGNISGDLSMSFSGNVAGVNLNLGVSTDFGNNATASFSASTSSDWGNGISANASMSGEYSNNNYSLSASVGLNANLGQNMNVNANLSTNVDSTGNYSTGLEAGIGNNNVNVRTNLSVSNSGGMVFGGKISIRF